MPVLVAGILQLSLVIWKAFPADHFQSLISIILLGILLEVLQVHTLIGCALHSALANIAE